MRDEQYLGFIYRSLECFGDRESRITETGITSARDTEHIGTIRVRDTQEDLLRWILTEQEMVGWDGTGRWYAKRDGEGNITEVDSIA
jgi:hypothetical protein